jgi:hypothetical protein
MRLQMVGFFYRHCGLWAHRWVFRPPDFLGGISIAVGASARELASSTRATRNDAMHISRFRFHQIVA